MDGMLAFLALGLVISPMLVLQAQAQEDLGKARLQGRVVLLAASVVEQLRAAPDASAREQVRVRAALTLWHLRPRKPDARISQSEARAIALTSLPHEDRSLPQALEVRLEWRDPAGQEIRMLVPL
jgi:Tfp pilus assembly protein PilV